MNARGRLVTIAVGLLVAVVAAGAVRPALAQAPPRGAGRPPEGVERRDTARFFLLQKMREELQLTDAQSLRVLDLMRLMDEERERHREDSEAIGKRLRALLDAEDTTDGQFREQVAASRAEQARFEARQRDLEGQVLEALTPRQQAGFVSLRRRLLQALRGEEAGPSARRGQGTRHGGRAP